jgi:hypothetical protein
MNSWLEEAERRESLRSIKTDENNLFNKKIIEENNELIKAFIFNLIGLIERVKKISHTLKPSNNEIGYTVYENDYKYEFYGSSLNLKNKKFLFINVGKLHYIIRRRIYFEISGKENTVKINVNEKHLSIPDSKWLKRYKNKYLIKIQRLDSTIQEKLVDWLVFRISNKEFLHHLFQNRNNEN